MTFKELNERIGPLINEVLHMELFAVPDDTRAIEFRAIPTQFSSKGGYDTLDLGENWDKSNRS